MNTKTIKLHSTERKLLKKYLSSNRCLFGSDTECFRQLCQIYCFLIQSNIDQDYKEDFKKHPPFVAWFVAVVRVMPAELFLLVTFTSLAIAAKNMKLYGDYSDNRLAAFLQCYDNLSSHIERRDDVFWSLSFREYIARGWMSLSDDDFREFIYDELFKTLSTLAKSEYYALGKSRGATSDEMDIEATKILRAVNAQSRLTT